MIGGWPKKAYGDGDQDPVVIGELQIWCGDWWKEMPGDWCHNCWIMVKYYLVIYIMNQWSKTILMHADLETELDIPRWNLPAFWLGMATVAVRFIGALRSNLIMDVLLHYVLTS